MKRNTAILAMTLAATMMCGPVVEARGRTQNAAGSGNSPSASSPSRPNNPGNNNRPNNPGNNNRPNNPGNNNRPNNPGNNNRPNNPGNNNRPNNPGNNNRPSNPGNNWGNGHGPHTPPPGPPMPPPGRPVRPNVPPSYHYYRPTPPPSWRPVGPVPTFGSILGVTFGAALNMSLNYLLNSGYTVVGYGSNEIYLNNVNQFGFTWPDATMYYTNGMLVGSNFAYATVGYNMSRYNRLYNTFLSQYGAPVSVQNLSNGGVQATWWGYNNTHITLAYYPEYAYNGVLRYFTTVSMGR